MQQFEQVMGDQADFIQRGLLPFGGKQSRQGEYFLLDFSERRQIGRGDTLAGEPTRRLAAGRVKVRFFSLLQQTRGFGRDGLS